MKVVWNGDIRLLVEGNFKRDSESDEFGKIWLMFLRVRIKN